MRMKMTALAAAVLLAASCAFAAQGVPVEWDAAWQYAEHAAICGGQGRLYEASAGAPVVAVNAGHGTKGGTEVETLCHPDGSPKVVSGTTKKGRRTSPAVAPGMKFPDGTPEPVVTLRTALLLRDALLARGISVLMLRESDDARLDNVARTVMANENADCHISLHFDSTKKDKGAFFIAVPNAPELRRMEPVASHWREHEELGRTLIASLRRAGVKIFGNGSIDMDLTQTSWSKIPTACLELADAASDISEPALARMADAIAEGTEGYLAERAQRAPTP